MSTEVAKAVERRIRRLPEWPDSFVEPEHPTFFIIERTANGHTKRYTITADFVDERSCEWFAHWIASKAGWEAFGDWLDGHR